MPRHIEVGFARRNVWATARLLDDEAPETAQAIWDALPQEGQAFHAKYANNEVYTLVRPFASPEPPLENATIFPIPGDLMYFYIPPSMPLPRTLREEAKRYGGLIDLAIFYGRNSFLLSAIGFVPGTVFAVIEQGLAEIADACSDVWSGGSVGERLVFRRRQQDG
jgi:hypothetical protein